MRAALQKVQALKCNRMSALGSYLVLLRTLLMQLTAGGEAITDGLKVEMLRKHLKECGGVQASFAAFNFMPLGE